MPYTPLYHPDIPRDLKLININIQKRIENAIQTRLETAPEQYGQPLRKTLRGYWKLRVGDYRVVFKIAANEIWIFGIINRQDVYHDIRKRLGWKPKN